MQKEFNSDLDIDNTNDLDESSSTLYAIAMDFIKSYIDVYLKLVNETKGFAVVEANNAQDYEQKLIILTGINSNLDPLTSTANDVVQEWQRRQAIIFDVEASITKGVYIQMREVAQNLIDELRISTNNFQVFEADYINKNPRMLPIFQRLINVRSKSELKKRVGNVSDNSISKPAAKRLADILNSNTTNKNIDDQEILQGLETTLEGIVRDLVGRVLLESIVATALDEANVPYKREKEYKYLEGVIYNFRSDFVVPDENEPKAFIEVRKSSSRHASLYAKDKMFSAINWKGKNKDILAILIVDGEWTAETLRIMANVFDYVVPIKAVSSVANSIAEYLQGDKSKLKWVIDFSIKPANEEVMLEDE
ncbi:MAG: hypothetical protein VKL60_03815 [Sphaerospermopsis sp.]|uniref:hypothetical protein n=2 Tax=Sphaerospermopsis TaxID=752201 RepID=UPI001C9BAE0E|nr:hypothetical protein [Sphaerospermopsis sp. LEGE 00249]MEB3148130.1 hypothetical protein [Sphaerospermopsis sp.]